jgi:hypothetical protein
MAYSYTQIANPNANVDPDAYGSQARANAVNQATMQKLWEQKRQKAIEEAMSQPGAIDAKGAPNELVVKRYLAAQGFGQTGYSQGNANTLANLQAQGQGAGSGLLLRGVGVEPHLGTQQQAPAAPDTSDRFLYPQPGDTALPQEDKLGSILRGKPITKQETTTRSTQAPNDIAREDATTVRVTVGAPKADSETFTLPPDNTPAQPTREPQSAIEMAAWSAQMPGGAQRGSIAPSRTVDVDWLKSMKANQPAKFADMVAGWRGQGLYKDSDNTPGPNMLQAANEALRLQSVKGQQQVNPLAVAGKMAEGKIGEGISQLGENERIAGQNRLAADANTAEGFNALAADQRGYKGAVQTQGQQATTFAQEQGAIKSLLNKYGYQVAPSQLAKANDLVGKLSTIEGARNDMASIKGDILKNPAMSPDQFNSRLQPVLQNLKFAEEIKTEKQEAAFENLFRTSQSFGALVKSSHGATDLLQNAVKNSTTPQQRGELLQILDKQAEEMGKHGVTASQLEQFRKPDKVKDAIKGVKRVGSAKDWDLLPNGANYIGPDGRKYTKGVGGK